MHASDLLLFITCAPILKDLSQLFQAVSVQVASPGRRGPPDVQVEAGLFTTSSCGRSRHSFQDASALVGLRISMSYQASSIKTFCTMESVLPGLHYVLHFFDQAEAVLALAAADLAQKAEISQESSRYHYDRLAYLEQGSGSGQWLFESQDRHRHRVRRLGPEQVRGGLVHHPWSAEAG